MSFRLVPGTLIFCALIESARLASLSSLSRPSWEAPSSVRRRIMGLPAMGTSAPSARDICRMRWGELLLWLDSFSDGWVESPWPLGWTLPGLGEPKKDWRQPSTNDLRSGRGIRGIGGEASRECTSSTANDAALAATGAARVVAAAPPTLDRSAMSSPMSGALLSASPSFIGRTGEELSAAICVALPLGELMNWPSAAPSTEPLA